jgi:hypothetical protein
MMTEQQQANFNWWMGMGRITKNVVWTEMMENVAIIERRGVNDRENTIYLQPQTLKGYIHLYESIGEENWINRVIPPTGYDKNKVLQVIRQLDTLNKVKNLI